jgi:hypothetical protein
MKKTLNFLLWYEFFKRQKFKIKLTKIMTSISNFEFFFRETFYDGINILVKNSFKITSFF